MPAKCELQVILLELFTGCTYDFHLHGEVWH